MVDDFMHDSDDAKGGDGDEGDKDNEGAVDNQISPSKPSHPISTPPQTYLS